MRCSCPNLTEEQFLNIKDKIEAIIDQNQDSVRYYRQCKKCLKDFEFSGIGEEPEIEDFQVL